MKRLRIIGALLVVVNGGQLFGQSNDGRPKPEAAIAQGIPDLRGLWQAIDTRNPRMIPVHFNVSQSGDSLSISRLVGGAPPVLVFEGAFKNEGIISGKVVNDNPATGWHPAEISVMDGNRLRLEVNLVFTRPTPTEAAIFNEQQRLSFQKLPEKPFDLGGEWKMENGPNVLLRQNGADFALMLLPNPTLFFKGQYTSNPEIVGQGWGSRATAVNKDWGERRIVIEDPDHIRYEGTLLYRVSDPPSRDVACDARNTYHVSGYFAVIRGNQAVAAKDYKTAKCWFTIGESWQIAGAQTMLAALIIGGMDGPPDYAVAFDLASKSAQAGDPRGMFQLAALYREGKGTAADPEKAAFWLDKAKRTEQMRAMMSPENMWRNVGRGLGIVRSLGDLDVGSMTPSSSCYAQQVLGNRGTSACSPR